MKTQWLNPIDKLKPELDSLIKHITNQFSSDLIEQIKNKKIRITYDIIHEKIKTPVAELESGKVKVQDVHLAFLWCCSYVTVAMNTMLYEEVLERNEDIVHLDNRPEFTKMRLTMNWAKSLQKEVSLWPDQAARPDRPDKWTESANNLFQACVAYLLFHEYGHLILHDDLVPLITMRKRNPTYETSEVDNAKIFNAEVEADRFAFNCLMGTSTMEEVRLMKFMGASLAQLSNFYLLDMPDTRGGRTHPDLDDRLKAVLNQINFINEDNEIQFRMRIIAGLQLFYNLTETEFIPENGTPINFPQIIDLEEYLFAMMTKMKNAARGIS